jgi:hypothetical protein
MAAGIVTTSDILEEEAAQKKKAKDQAEAALKYEEDIKTFRRGAAVAFGNVSTLKEQINNATAQMDVAIFIKESQEKAAAAKQKQAAEKSGEKPKGTSQGKITKNGEERTFLERVPFRNGAGFLYDFVGFNPWTWSPYTLEMSVPDTSVPEPIEDSASNEDCSTKVDKVRVHRPA